KCRSNVPDEWIEPQALIESGPKTALSLLLSGTVIDQVPPLTTITIPPLMLITPPSTESLPERARRKNFVWLVRVSSGSEPRIFSSKSDSRLTSRLTLSVAVSPSEKIPSEPFTSKDSGPIVNFRPAASSSDEDVILMSRKPVAEAKPRNSTEPSSRRRNPASTVLEPSGCDTPVVLIESSALAENLRPTPLP